jgi:hypothetical protein
VCCTVCRKAVKADSEKCLKKLEAEGGTLDKMPQAATTNAPAAPDFDPEDSDCHL